MNIVVTGAGGFVGEYLVRLLLHHGHRVTAVGIQNGTFLEKMPVFLYTADITDYEALRLAFQAAQPEAVIHLAAVSNVPVSWEKPALTADVNIRGSIHVLEALREVNRRGRLLNIGSSDQYGLTAKQGLPLTEEMLCQPQNPYAISKACAEQMVLQLGKKYGMQVISTRSFNHFGPGQALGFVVSDFAAQIRAIRRGEKEPVLRVGDLSAARDFTFVGDVAAAYVALIEEDVPAGVYNICSGQARQIADVLETMIRLSGEAIEVEVDEGKLRPSEVPFFVGDGRKIKNAIGWEPTTAFDEGIRQVLS